MNFKQQIVVVIGVLAIGFCVVFVPWATYVPLDTPEGILAETQYNYGLLNRPPDNPLAIKAPEVVWIWQFQKIGAVLIVNALLLFCLRSRKTKKRATFTSRATAQAAF